MADVKRSAKVVVALVRYFSKGEKKESIAEPSWRQPPGRMVRGRLVLLDIAQEEDGGLAVVEGP